MRPFKCVRSKCLLSFAPASISSLPDTRNTHTPSHLDGVYRGIGWNLSRSHEGKYSECWLTDALDQDLNPDDLFPEADMSQRDVVSAALVFLRQRNGEGYEAAYRVCVATANAVRSPAWWWLGLSVHRLSFTEDQHACGCTTMTDRSIYRPLL